MTSKKFQQIWTPSNALSLQVWAILKRMSVRLCAQPTGHFPSTGLHGLKLLLPPSQRQLRLLSSLTSIIPTNVPLLLPPPLQARRRSQSKHVPLSSQRRRSLLKRVLPPRTSLLPPRKIYQSRLQRPVSRKYMRLCLKMSTQLSHLCRLNPKECRLDSWQNLLGVASSLSQQQDPH